MQNQSVSSSVRQNIIKRKREQKHRNIRAKSTGTPQVITDNSFLKQQFIDIPLTDIVPQTDYPEIVSPEQNMKRLIKAASNYLALYGNELSFTPTGNFKRDITSLIHSVTQLLPKGQLLNMDYINNELVFVVYQSNPERYWSTIVYIPVSIAHTMRLKIRRLFIRFIAFIMQQNYLPTIKDTYDYDYYVEYIAERRKEKDEEVDKSHIETVRSYKNKKGKAYRMLQQIEQCKLSCPNELLAELKNLKHISLDESEQIKCMIRGLELSLQNRLSKYIYDETYDDYHQEYFDDEEKTRWDDLICISWGTFDQDALIEFHFEALNDRCNNFGATEPHSYMILSPEKSEKLLLCTFPFEWLDYICNDFYKHLVINE